jgi:hypothetical protein
MMHIRYHLVIDGYMKNTLNVRIILTLKSACNNGICATHKHACRVMIAIIGLASWHALAYHHGGEGCHAAQGMTDQEQE